MKNGLHFENDELIYYVNDEPKHAGVIKVDGAIYYISSGGRAIKGQHIVHGEMTNDLLKRGTYTFGDDYKLIKGSYIAPKKKSVVRKNKKNLARTSQLMRKRILKILNKKRNLAVIGAMLLFVVFLLCLRIAPIGHHSVSEDPQLPNEQEIKITLPSFNEDVLLCSSAAKMVYDGELTIEESVKTGDPYRPFFFEYYLENASGKLYLSEKEDLSEAGEYVLEANNQSISIDNLKVDTTYYYAVVVDDKEYKGSFHTAKSNRFLSIPGLKNVRDVGGYVSQDGKTVKQGLLIRGVEIDGLVNASYYVPDDELENIQNTFGFVYDMDLRQPTIYGGAYTTRLGVPHKFYAAPQYGEIFNPNFYSSLRSIFTDLANFENYPMYLHCTWGKDRTGTIVFLLQGILNVSEEDMIREYRLTGYTHDYIATTTNMDVVINGLHPYAGNTLQEKIVTFLTTDVGVTESEIETIREIFLEK